MAQLVAHELPGGHAAEVLDRVGNFDDDRPSFFEEWLAHNMARLPPGVAGDVEAWIRTCTMVSREPSLDRSAIR